jgi:hypothetical protein
VSGVHLMHCVACDDVQYLTAARSYCRCGRSSGRLVRSAVVLVGPARILNADHGGRSVDVVRPSAAVGT